MKIEKNMLYQISILIGIIISILLCFVFWQLMLIFPIILYGGIILLIIIRRKGHLDDERALKLSEKASEKTIITFIFGSMFLLFIIEPIFTISYVYGSNIFSRSMQNLSGLCFKVPL